MCIKIIGGKLLQQQQQQAENTRSWLAVNLLATRQTYAYVVKDERLPWRCAAVLHEMDG